MVVVMSMRGKCEGSNGDGGNGNVDDGGGDGGDDSGDGGDDGHLKKGGDERVYSMRNILYSLPGYHTQ